MRLVWFLSLMLMTQGLCAATPMAVIKSTIEDGVEIVAGDPLEFDASDSVEAKVFRWVVEPGVTSGGRPTFKQSEDRKKLSIFSRQGSYRLTLLVANDEDIATASRVIVVGKPVGPGPGPEPPPPLPLPVPEPEGRFGLAKDVFGWGQNVAAEHKKLSAALAENYRRVGSKAGAGGFQRDKTGKALTDQEQRSAIALATKEGNTSILGTEGAARAAWLPLFTELGKRMKSLEDSKTLKSADDLPFAWFEIAAGLDRVK